MPFRPDEWDLPLFLHILGAMVLVGALVLTATYLFGAWRRGSADSLRFAYRSLLWGAIPGFLVMRVAAQWIYSKEGYDDLPSDPNWIGIGFGISDFGLLLLIVATVGAGLGVRRASAATADAGAVETGTSVRVAAVAVALLLVLYLVAIWAMTTKPT